jgi:uncharacterized protein
MRGAGGSKGGVGEFWLGLVMLIGGGYLLLDAIAVNTHFGLGMRLYSVDAWGRSFGITSGMVLIPFMFGVGMIFYNARNWLGWLLAGGAMVALVFGVIASLQFSLRSMTAFELLTILVLLTGGLGLFLRSLRPH